MQGGKHRKVVTRSQCFWCLSLFLFCIKLTEENKILPVGHQSSGPLDMCFVIPFLSKFVLSYVLSCSFLSWPLSGQGPLRSWHLSLAGIVPPISVGGVLSILPYYPPHDDSPRPGLLPCSPEPSPLQMPLLPQTPKSTRERSHTSHPAWKPSFPLPMRAGP
jgi:hypothetical protein